MCSPEDLLFTPLLQFARVPFQAKESVHKTPFCENVENFSLYGLNFHPKFSSQIWKFSAHKPQNLKIFSSQAPKFGFFQFTSPTLRKSGPHTPTWKTTEYPPGSYLVFKLRNLVLNYTKIIIWAYSFEKKRGRVFARFESIFLRIRSLSNARWFYGKRRKIWNVKIDKVEEKCGVRQVITNICVIYVQKEFWIRTLRCGCAINMKMYILEPILVQFRIW